MIFLEKKSYNWVLIFAGTNDLLKSNKTGDEIVENIIKMLEISHAMHAETLVLTIPKIFCEVKNCSHVSEKRKFINKHLRRYAMINSGKAHVCDIALKLSRNKLSPEERKDFWEPSGVHLTSSGYDKVAEIVYQSLMEAIHLFKGPSLYH